ncbi:MAG: adenosylcobinamide-phosphate synthase CbiB [Marinifilaceae bacterium]
MQINHIIIPLIAGYILDFILGDPRKLPHPIIAFGNSISFFEKHLNKGDHKVFKGAITAITLPTIVFFIFYALTQASINLGEISYYIFTSVFVFYGLANRSLVQEGAEVIKQLENNGLEAGRKRLSWIVGRETKDLSEQEIYKAVLETLAENLSDGVVAPLFFYLVGGVPAMLTYKMINTLDSMIGYKSKRYKQFGMFAARIDDVANYIPARITALLMSLAALSFKSFKYIFKYGNKHASPNAGYPESALAGILDCQFGGPHMYYGEMVQKPFIGDKEREIVYKDFKKTKAINLSVSFISIILIIIISYCIF